jgi:Family of unknown function (DUF6526)
VANQIPQTYANHSRLDPPFHFFILPVFAITAVGAIVHLVMHPGLYSAWMVVFAIGAAFAVVKARLYALKVQDRVIRLEQRLRLASVLQEPLRSRICELSEAQLIGLRFAPDSELPQLVGRVLSEKLQLKDIKKSVQQWQADYWRV